MPVETFELIAEYLDLRDLRRLRFACMEVNVKIIATKRFKRFCRNKSVEPQVSSLKDLEAQLCKPGIQTYLEHLTVTGVLLVMEGLEQIKKEKTKPSDLEDPCNIRLNELGNPLYPCRGMKPDSRRVAASEVDL